MPGRQGIVKMAELATEPVVRGEVSQERIRSEKLYRASQWQLMFWKLGRHRLAIVSGVILIMLYLIALFAPFVAPYKGDRRSEYLNLPPQRLHFRDALTGQISLRPFIYGLEKKRNPETLALEFTEKLDEKYYLRFLVRDDAYKLWGLIQTDLHLFGVEGGRQVFLFGADGLGRDLFSRTILASMISLSVGLAGIALSFLLGVIIGGISGFYGGQIDTIIQQLITFLAALPTIPIWMGLSAAIPGDWPPLKIYFGITLVLSLVGWTGLARVVRGRILQLREEAFVTAARLAGSSNRTIIFGHLVPSFASYLIVHITLALPNMILGETALSFIGLGLREPVISWGVLLQAAQNVRSVALYPWLMTPALFVIVTTLAFNFLGDGLRDAADPYA
jgi:peptide/nickel transport system permease protein